MKDWKVKVKEPKDFVKDYEKGYQQATADFINDEIKFLDKINFNEIKPKEHDFDLDIIQAKLINERLLKLKQMLVEK